MDEKNHKNNTGGSGFMWGMLIGAVLMFLFSTKTGRKILKELSSKGIDMLEELASQNGFDLPYDEEELEDETPYQKSVQDDLMEDDFQEEEKIPEHKTPVQTQPITNHHSAGINGHTTSTRRFFRGAKRK